MPTWIVWRSAFRRWSEGCAARDKEAKKALDLVERALVLLREGKPARLTQVSDEERTAFKALNLLTAKPVLYVCNVDEASAATGNAHSRRVEERAKDEGAGCVIISAKIEGRACRA